MALITSCWMLDAPIILAAVLVPLYLFFKTKFTYWKKRGIPVPEKPSIPFGNFTGVFQKRNMSLIPADLYNVGKNEKFLGAYFFTKPIFIVRDPELVKSMLVKDFNFFHDRGFFANLKKEPLAGHLFLLSGSAWRNLRIRLTPTFTSGKMKMMFPTLLDVGKHLVAKFEEEVNEPETEVKDILARYTTDVISSCAFGIETNSLKNPDNEFRKLGVSLAEPTFTQNVVNTLATISPLFVNYLPLRVIPQKVNDFFIGLVRDTMQYRKDNNVKRNDFLQLLMQIREKGYVPDADNPENDKLAENQKKFTVEEAAAQSFLFFFAGFETSSATMQFALYELALNPDLQKAVQKDIDEFKSKHDGQITYDALQEMTLLDKVVSETLRKYPVAPVLIRECSEDYRIPGTDVTLEKGTNVWFPVYGYQHDPQYYPEPEKFDPERFSPEVKEERHPYVYLPFGEGPRNCIGNRFALMQTKVGLALILSEFSISPSKNTPIPIVFVPGSGLLSPEGHMNLKISKRQ